MPVTLSTAEPDFEPRFAALLAAKREDSADVGDVVAAIIDDVNVHPATGRIKLALGPGVPALDGKTILIAPTRDINDQWKWLCIPVDIPKRWLPKECR